MRTAFFLLFSGVAHFLAARWLLSTYAAGPVGARRRRAIVVTALVLTSFLAAARLVSSMHETGATRTVVAVAMLELGAVMIALVPIGLMTLGVRIAALLFGSRTTRRVASPVPAPVPAPVPVPVPVLSRRAAIERVAGLSIFGAATAALGWGMVRGRHAFELEEVVVRVKGWPRALDGYVIAQVSDVHVGSFVGDRELDEGFELVRRIRPDLVVATGDLVDFESRVVDLLGARLMGIAARDGACAILGNHDHYGGAADVMKRLRAQGVRVLSNQSVRLRGGDGGGFALVGVDDLHGRTGRTPGFSGPDLAGAVAGLAPDLPRILLAHQPKFFPEAAGRVALQLSGHTHGGQINPGFRPADLLMDYVAGRYEREGSTLWVNRGFGVVGPPSRLGAPPEVTKIVLVAG